MLYDLSVKNFALIKEANIVFKDNLNILTGETGSGKSILIGSLNLALGKRANRDSLREGDDTVVSITFLVNDKNIKDKLKEMDIDLEDGDKVIIYRKITKDKNISKINDIPCTLNKIKELTELLIDIYGQHDSEDLRKNNKHIMFLDDFIGKESENLKNQIKVKYEEVKVLKNKLSTFNMDEKMRLREIDLLKYEIEELENANLKEGEEEELSQYYKKMSNSKNIITNLYEIKENLKILDISKSIKLLKEILKYDENLKNIESAILDLDSIASDTISEIDDIVDNFNVDEEKLYNAEKRLNQIRQILMKYDDNINVAIKSLEEKNERLSMLSNYEEEKNKLKNELENKIKELKEICSKLSVLRKEKSLIFENKLKEEMKDLGFLDIKFKIDFKEKDLSLDGMDDITFYISLNVGEKLRPLSEVASGGELSRIMLSIKTILSDNIGTETLIFDEIDQGISGITASKVATKLNKIAKNHQVICITHLPQIASMADNHFVIKKEIENNNTYTKITNLDEEGSIKEIARLVASNENLTETSIANAKELKDLAKKEKTR